MPIILQRHSKYIVFFIVKVAAYAVEKTSQIVFISCCCIRHLFENGIFLPCAVPVPPPDAEEDDAHADGHDTGQ